MRFPAPLRPGDPIGLPSPMLLLGTAAPARVGVDHQRHQITQELS